ncbi:MAG: protein kinase domain-containing protein [Gemmatimonadaceae bacterium]
MDPLTQLRTSLAAHYEIEREIGAGGMATVYLARDLRHDRHVALKVLKPDLGAVLGVERFLSEIKVTANLQHPNLLPLFDSGEAEGLLYYVMPYVEGESLRSRLDREKQLPIDEAIRISVAIANALEYAHAHGVIHRDLKPENILLQSGQPVIADFGIALAVSNAGGNRITQTGLSLGTPAYMSPEQATGDRVIDARSDIYSLGAMTYEMLTGEPPHTGSTSQAVIARMLTEKPRPIRTTRAAVPEYVEATVQRALEKLPADRFSSVRQYAEGLQGRGDFSAPSSFATARLPAARKPRAWADRFKDPLVVSLAVLSLILIGVASLRGRDETDTSLPVRYVLSTPDSARAEANAPWPGAISTDGSTIVYYGRSPEGATLYAQRTDQLDARAIPGTVGALQPIFSPDGQWVAFQLAGKQKKVRLDGSAPINVADAGSQNGADWTTRDEMVFGAELNFHGLSRVSASGGRLQEFTRPDTSKGETDHLWPIALPDAKTVVFTIWSGSLASAKLATASLEGGDVVPLDLLGVRPLAVIGRILVYVQSDGAVMAVTLDRSGRHAAGAPTPVLDPIEVRQGLNGNSEIFVSKGGALLTSRGGTNTRLAWIARDGSVTPLSSETRQFGTPRLSPDGSRVAVAIREAGKSAIWIYEIATGTFSRLSSPEAAISPSWTPDGNSVVYTALSNEKRYAVWRQNADGGSPAEKLFDALGFTIQSVVAPDGRSVLYVGYANNNWRLFRVALDSPTVATQVVENVTAAVAPAFSPDGKWVMFTSVEESGQSEVYVRSYPDLASRVQVSAGGGVNRGWTPDGSRVYYGIGGGALLSATLATTPRLRVVARDTVFKTPPVLAGSGPARPEEVARDGRFLGLVTNRNDYQLVIVPNWLPELKKRLAGAH